MKVLAVGAHPDDIELGCAGTLAAHVAAGDEVTMLVMTDGKSGPGNVVQRTQEQETAALVLDARLLWGQVPDLLVGNYEMMALQVIEKALQATGATRMYTHSADDTHQDHRAVALCSFGAARNLQEVLTYDSPSSRDFHANLYVDVTEYLDVKIKALMCHASQVEASNRVNMDFVQAQAIYRGGLVRVGAAEAFHVERMLLHI